MGHDKGLTSKHFMHIQGDLAGKLLEALAHAEVSNALHIAMEALSESYIPSGGSVLSRRVSVAVVAQWQQVDHAVQRHTLLMQQCQYLQSAYRRHVCRIACGKDAVLRFAVAVAEQLHVLQLAQGELRLCQVAHSHRLHGAALTHVHLCHPAWHALQIHEEHTALNLEALKAGTIACSEGCPCTELKFSVRQEDGTPGWAVSDDLAPRWRPPNASTDKGILSHETLDNRRNVSDLPPSGFQQQI